MPLRPIGRFHREQLHLDGLTGKALSSECCTGHRALHQALPHPLHLPAHRAPFSTIILCKCNLPMHEQITKSSTVRYVQGSLRVLWCSPSNQHQCEARAGSIVTTKCYTGRLARLPALHHPLRLQALRAP